MRCTWVLFLLCLLLPACLQQSRARLHNTTDLLCSHLDSSSSLPDSDVRTHEKQSAGSLDYRLCALTLEAQYTDIPIPLGSEPIADFFRQDSDDEKGVILGYTHKAERQKMYDFFKAECPRLGWVDMGGMQGVESMLMFEKPDRLCMISFRSAGDEIAIIISVCPKISRDV